MLLLHGYSTAKKLESAAAAGSTDGKVISGDVNIDIITVSIVVHDACAGGNGSCGCNHRRN